jgi:hypothetical protein
VGISESVAGAALWGGGNMPFDQLLVGCAFDTETIVVITEAFETACRDLRLTDRRDPITEVLALKIIEAAKTGERDPNIIRQQAMDLLAAKPLEEGRRA